MSVTIETLSDLQREGYVVYAECARHGCGRGRPLDIAALIERFGPEHSIICDTAISSRLRCSCGHRGASLRIRPRYKSEPANTV